MSVPYRGRSFLFLCAALSVAWGPGPLEARAGGPASGIVELSNLDISEFPNSPADANDVWGYVSPSGREYALLGMENQTAFIDVTDPENPVILDTYPHVVTLWSDMAVYQDHAYIVTDGAGDGVTVMDLSDIDNGNVTWVRNYKGPLDDRFLTSHNIKVNETSGYAYLLGVVPVGMRILDVSTPNNPVLVRNWFLQGIHDAYIKTYDEGPYAGREIAFLAAETNGLTILDVTDKSNIIPLTQSLLYETTRYCHQLWPTEDDRFLLVGDELDERDHPDVSATTTYVFNIEDLENVFLVGSFTNGEPAIDHNLMVRGSYAFEANYHSGLRVWDIHRLNEAVVGEPLDMVREVAHYDTYPGDNGLGFDGAWGVYTQLPSRNVLVSDINRGLFVFDVTAAVEPSYGRRVDTAVSNEGETDGVAWVERDTNAGIYISNRDAVNANQFVVRVGDEFTAVDDANLVQIGDTRSSVWADLDADGDLDAYITRSSGANMLLRKDEDTVYTDITVAPLDDIGDARGAAFADFDGDTDLDLYVSNQGGANRLFRNDGLDTWVDVASDVGVDAGAGTIGAAWGDYDGDGDPDLAVADVGGTNYLYRNDGGTTFTPITLTGIPWRSQTMGVVWADVDGDLDLDLFITNFDRQDALYRNDGSDVFVDATSVLGLPTAPGASIGATWGDYDRDGRIDLFLTQLGGGLRLFRGTEDEFVDLSELNFGDQAGMEATGVATADYDRDGDLDVYVANRAGANALYENVGESSGTWLAVDLQGAGFNIDGIGARVEVFDGISWQMREISAGLGYLSQEPPVAYFGLPGDAAEIVRVRWPAGTVTDSLDIAGNRRITVLEDGATPIDGDDGGPTPPVVAGYRLFPNAPNPFNPVTRIAYELGEPTPVWLTIHDIAGRRVRVLPDGLTQRKGRWEARWDGLDDGGRPVASGVYRYRLRAGAFAETRSMTLLR